MNLTTLETVFKNNSFFDLHFNVSGECLNISKLKIISRNFSKAILILLN